MNKIIALFALLAVSLAANAQQFVEGTHYQRLADAPAHTPGEPIEVVEVFWYGCPACYQFSPLVERWLETRPVDVEFSRVGAVLNPNWRIHARAYYTAESLGVVEQVHPALFRAIHEQRNMLADANAIARVFAQAGGVAQADFQRTWDSFGVETRLRRGDQFARRARVNSTPTVVVAGTYTFGPASAGSYDGAIALLNFLIEQVRGAPSVPIEPGTALPQSAPATQQPSAQAEPVEPPAERETAGFPVWMFIVGGVIVLAGIGVMTLRGRS